MFFFCSFLFCSSHLFPFSIFFQVPLSSYFIFSSTNLISSHHIISYRIISYHIELYCIVLYCIALYCIVLYCIVSFLSFSFLSFSFLVLYYSILPSFNHEPHLISSCICMDNMASWRS